MKLPVNYGECTPQESRMVREEYVRIQGGLCSHCGSSLDGSSEEKIDQLPIKYSLFPPNFFKWPVHLHHDHNTGMTIGAVHNKCNAVLWQYHGE